MASKRNTYNRLRKHIARCKRAALNRSEGNKRTAGNERAPLALADEAAIRSHGNAARKPFSAEHILSQPLRKHDGRHIERTNGVEHMLACRPDIKVIERHA